MVYDEKNCCFSTFAQYNPQSGQTKKVSLISERAEKSWGGEGHTAPWKSQCGGGRFIHTCILGCTFLSKGCETGAICGYTEGVPFLAKIKR